MNHADKISQAMFSETAEELIDGLSVSFSPDHGFGKLLADSIADLLAPEGSPDCRERLACRLRALSLGQPVPETVIPAAVCRAIGPMTLKVLRRLDPAGINVDFSTFMLALQSSARPLDAAYVQAKTDEIVRSSKGVLTSLTVGKTAGISPAGQDFFCTATCSDRKIPCILCLLRPGIREHAQQEAAVFRSHIQPDSGLETSFGALENEVFQELDLTMQAQNAAEAAAGYTLGSSPSVLTECVLEGVPPTADMLLLKQAPGRTLAHLLVDTLKLPEALRQASEPLSWVSVLELQNKTNSLYDTYRNLCTLFRRWFGTAVLQTGFCPTDLRALRLLAAVPKQALTDDGNMLPTGPVTLRCGPAVHLSSAARPQMLRLTLGAFFARPDWVLTGYLGLLPANDRARTLIRRDELADLIASALKGGTRQDGPVRQLSVLLRLQQHGFPCTGEFAAVTIGLMRMQQILGWTSALASDLQKQLRLYLRENIDRIVCDAAVTPGAWQNDPDITPEIRQEYIRILLEENIPEDNPVCLSVMNLLGELFPQSRSTASSPYTIRA